jgi:hypothetical protein
MFHRERLCSRVRRSDVFECADDRFGNVILLTFAVGEPATSSIAFETVSPDVPTLMRLPFRRIFRQSSTAVFLPTS